ncbi:hypothetical protein [uncultured Umboniibacter sp.]|uniref:hypothetical protein n=1 Tax=uncultured Umboniibacter sp. TaxID=1798917 RepID=UPI00260FD72F|nr:hypothetical protein [uncultured Umboniibacter sp.]
MDNMSKLKFSVLFIITCFILVELWSWHTHRKDFSEKINIYEQGGLHWDYYDDRGLAVYSRTFEIPLSLIGLTNFPEETINLRISKNADERNFAGLYYNSHVPAPVGYDWPLTGKAPELVSTSNERLFYLSRPWIFNGREVRIAEIMEKLGVHNDFIWVHSNFGYFNAYRRNQNGYQFVATCTISFTYFTRNSTQCKTGFDVDGLAFRLLLPVELLPELDEIRARLINFLDDDIARFLAEST